MAKKVTMQQIANYLGVSKFVVSKALSGKGGVSEATKEKVIEAAAQLGYFAQRPSGKPPKQERMNAAVEGMKQSVLVLMPNIRFQTKESLYWGRILDGISAELNKRGIGMVILSEQNAEHLTGLINPDAIMGMIGVGEISSEMLLDIHRLGMTMVLVDHENDLLPLDSIFADNFEAVFRLTKQLLAMGKDNIMFAGDIQFSRSFYDRFLGYRAAIELTTGGSNRPDTVKLSNYGLNHSLLKLDGLETEHFIDSFRRWLKELPELPQAVICANDKIALGLLHVLKEKGIDVPQQVAVTGFDNIEDSYMSELPLTTVHVPKEMLGKNAVERLINRLQHPEEPIVKLLVKSDIIYRESTLLKVERST